MLKTKIRGLILGLAVLAGSAYVTPTYASSASILITQIRPGTAVSALEELVVLYNTTPDSIDVTGWCLFNKSGKEFGCLESDVPYERIRILPYSYALVVSMMQAQLFDEGDYTISYSPTHASNGSIVGSSDVITLVDDEGSEVDSFSWSSLPSNNLYWQRINTPFQDRRVYYDTDRADNWYMTALVGAPLEQPLPNVEWFIDEPVVVEPEPEPESEPGQDPEPADPISPMIRLNEILPNVAGSDIGNEFIELHNTGEHSESLSSYSLVIGKALEKSYAFPDVQIEPGGYAVFKDSELGFSLLNTNSKVGLKYNDQLIDETEYTDPKDDHAWSLAEGIWRYMKPSSPGVVNLAAVEPAESETPKEEASLKPCAPNQYRNPETNRCRLIATKTSSLQPCKQGQERSSGTNRCRNIGANSKEPAPCKEGQERNPETNRCRNVVKVTEIDYGVLGVQSEAAKDDNFLPWIIGGAVAAGVAVYALWEWRDGLARLWRRLVARLATKNK